MIIRKSRAVWGYCSSKSDKQTIYLPPSVLNPKRASFLHLYLPYRPHSIFVILGFIACLVYVKIKTSRCQFQKVLELHRNIHGWWGMFSLKPPTNLEC